MEDGQRDSQDYSNDQIDSIVDPVVKSRRSDIVSKEGSDYAEGWVAGIKDGMRR